jgi:hypothetical protein
MSKPINNTETTQAQGATMQNLNLNPLVECEYAEGIALSDSEHYERVETTNADGDIVVIGFFTEEGLAILKALWKANSAK